MDKKKKTVVLIAFYNVKALGVRYLDSYLKRHGYNVVTIFFKAFNSRGPTPATILELDLLVETIRASGAFIIGLSVMSSMYMDTVNAVLGSVKKCGLPVVCGGAYATMFPQRMLDAGADFVLRSDGEIAMCALADALHCGRDFKNVPSLCYKKGGKPVFNSVDGVLNDIDGYGIPSVKCEHAYFIENNTVKPGDPQLFAMSYEVIASRGCPFTCSYCCCSNLGRLLPKGTKKVRTRSVQSVIDELLIAKRELKNLVFVHFYDEIFPNLPGWVDEFVSLYDRHIHLPFTIWSHPKMVDGDVLKKLVSVGLCEVICGVQSGSVHIRRDIFHRYETNGEILSSVKKIKRSGVFWASYDFMLNHPFESLDDLKQTFHLVRRFQPPFELQLHGLNFLPGTDIIPLAIENGVLTKEEMDKIVSAPMEEQFAAYWCGADNSEAQIWYRLIFLLQFSLLRKRAVRLSKNIQKNQYAIGKLYRFGMKLLKLRYVYKKARMVLKSLKMRFLSGLSSFLEKNKKIFEKPLDK